MLFHRRLVPMISGLAMMASCRPASDAQPAPMAILPPAGGLTSINNRSSGAFMLPATNLNAEELADHIKGDNLFAAEYVSAPAPVHAGLGPVFNNTSCQGCHIKNGRGMPAIGGLGHLRSHMLLRLSIAPDQLADFGLEPAAHGAPTPVPGLGGQLQNHAIVGAVPEAYVTLTWEEIQGHYDDGTAYTLRRPRITFSGSPAAVELLQKPGVLWSIRQSPPVFGLGLLEAVSEGDLRALEDPEDRNLDGIKGHLNQVWDPSTQQMSVGRFGWKASAPNLLVQSAGAFAEDMGISNPIFPAQDTSPDIDAETLKATAYYVQTLAVPNRDSELLARSGRGAELFAALQCASCHQPTLKTSGTHPIAALRDQVFAPYTDLLLHDMGEGLADGRADYLANEREWRTSPLWGLGLTQTVLPHSGYLHDGRALTLEEAILWHGGEAAKAQAAFKALSLQDRQALIGFLRSL